MATLEKRKVKCLVISTGFHNQDAKSTTGHRVYTLQRNSLPDLVVSWTRGQVSELSVMCLFFRSHVLEDGLRNTYMRFGFTERG